MNELNISKRLQTIATFVPKEAYFADIGADHGYLASYICMKDETAYGIASDVNEGPLLSAKHTVEKYSLKNRISLRLGDGLSAIKSEQVTTVIIAGMGGNLISNILQNGREHLTSVQRLILQPNIGEAMVRKWLYNNHFSIVDEKVIEEQNKIYEIIVADKIKNDEQMTEKDFLFGPILRNERSCIFLKKWQERKNRLQGVLRQMKQGKNVDKEKFTSFQEQLLWIKEELENET
ncbi:MAG TPA: class I SAM-dependent methyltransferase [Bacillota bacterium]|nr:class I SAM-dependent methyltransferase [Bacillota bacterium]